jgi:BlaI family transcriptional regulator, penicillinase repressor
VYLPTADLAQVQRSTLSDMLDTFFNGSMEDAVAAMLGLPEAPRSAAELDRLAQLIEEARRSGGES